MEVQIKITKTVSFTKTIDIDNLVEEFNEAIDGCLECSEADEMEIESTEDTDVELV